MLKTFLKKIVYSLHKETHETISTLDKGSMTKHASISRGEAYVKLLCWGACPPRSRNTGGGPIKWLLLKNKL